MPYQKSTVAHDNNRVSGVIPELGAKVPASEPPRAGAIMHENCLAYMLGTTSQKEEHPNHLSDWKCTTTDIGSVHLENTSHFSVSANYLWNSSSIKENDFWVLRLLEFSSGWENGACCRDCLLSKLMYHPASWCVSNLNGFCNTSTIKNIHWRTLEHNK